jgi:hypothetical protein
MSNGSYSVVDSDVIVRVAQNYIVLTIPILQYIVYNTIYSGSKILQYNILIGKDIAIKIY